MFGCGLHLLNTIFFNILAVVTVISASAILLLYCMQKKKVVATQIEMKSFRNAFSLRVAHF